MTERERHGGDAAGVRDTPRRRRDGSAGAVVGRLVDAIEDLRRLDGLDDPVAQHLIAAVRRQVQPVEAAERDTNRRQLGWRDGRTLVDTGDCGIVTGGTIPQLLGGRHWQEPPTLRLCTVPVSSVTS